MRDIAGDALELAGLAYESPGRPDGWDAFLHRIGETIGATAPGLYLYDPTTDAPLMTAVRDVESRAGRDYERHFARLDLRRRQMRTLPEGHVFVGPELVPDRSLLRSEFYADFLRPQGFFQILGAVALRTDDTIGIVRVIRSRNEPSFDAEHRELLARLVPHLRRSLAVHHHLTVAQVRHDDATDVLDRFLVGVLLLDGRGRVRAANRRAEQLLALQDGLRADRDGLRAAAATESTALRALVAATARGTPSGGALAITRPSGREPFHVLVTPLRSPLLTGLAHSATAIVFVTDPDQHPVPARARLRRHLGLTTAEADVALLIAQGYRVDEAAGLLGISQHTARTQLKHALARTGMRRQSALVRLVLATPPVDDGLEGAGAAVSPTAVRTS
ncbi:MAG TPA: hypothetical protein VGR62_04095 [Candidatus Binatia bacterium]|jgi:DNA-binding CsgD family transcriptional regulator|nr:hypothetical protein [Candidatus Binatia bacterium]